MKRVFLLCLRISWLLVVCGGRWLLPDNSRSERVHDGGVGVRVGGEPEWKNWVVAKKKRAGLNRDSQVAHFCAKLRAKDSHLIVKYIYMGQRHLSLQKTKRNTTFNPNNRQATTTVCHSLSFWTLVYMKLKFYCFNFGEQKPDYLWLWVELQSKI